MALVCTKSKFKGTLIIEGGENAPKVRIIGLPIMLYICSRIVLSTTVMSTVCVYLPSTHMAILEGTQ